MAAHSAEDWVFMAYQDPSWRPGFSLAMMGGQMDADYGSQADTVTGVEIAFNSLLLQPRKRHRIRQQISHLTYNANGARISTFEANPHYLVMIQPNLELGFGPGVALVDVGSRNKERVLGLQLGASLHYRYQDFFLGAELRHQFTGSASVNGSEVDADNTRLLIKLGFWL